MRTAIFIVAFIVLSIGIAFTIRTTDIDKLVLEKKKNEKKDKEEDEESARVTILNKWDVPEILKEISALTYINKDRFACVQDEVGKIFIYNTSTKNIEKEIPFAGTGDYEGLAIAGQTAYVLRADGRIFEVKNYLSSKPSAIEHRTHLTARQDTEGICYDAKNNRLLIAIKGSEPGKDGYKGIYSFNLAHQKMDNAPVFKIDLNDPVFEDVKAKKPGSEMQPSAIAIHPETNDIYITEGAKPKLLILDNGGKIKALKKLSSSDFNQPEGITFAPNGSLYISNEGGDKEPGNILELKDL